MKRALALTLFFAGCSSHDSPRAGVVDDNRRFGDYRAYFESYPKRDVRKIDVTDRLVLRFVDRDGAPLSRVPVRFSADGREVYRTFTTAGGHALFPPRAVGEGDECRFEAEIAGTVVRFGRDTQGDLVVPVRSCGFDGVDVEIAFCIDTTGSMSDEIDKLKRSLRSVVERLDGLCPRPRFRFAAVVYRDRGDDYLTRLSDFTGDLDAFLRTLRSVSASGGGDYEEAVDEGLRRAVDELSWGGGDSIRMLFLLGDAPPHGRTGEEAPYTATLRRAIERGIQISTIAASGLDDKGEFVWRQVAQLTLGKFFFLSYDGTTRHHVGPYRENDLDELLVRAIRDEIEALRSAPARPRPGQGRAPDDWREWQD